MRAFLPRSDRMNGFTLIEIAIVLVVMGLLIGGVMIGRTLIQSSENQGMLSDARAVADSLRRFEAAYNAKPGDMMDAGNRLPGGPPNGDGNGAIETANSNNDNELGLLWLHLQAADLLPRSIKLTAVDTRYQAQSSQNSNVGYQVQEFPGLGLVMILSSYSAAAAGQGVFTPADAAAIDQAADDGNPDAGFIRGMDGADTPGLCTLNGAYQSSEPKATCQMVYLLQSDAINTTDVQEEDVACGKVGQVRPTISGETCATGFIGQVWDTCMPDGQWRTSHKDCQAVQCDAIATIGQTRVVGCGTGYTGSITQRCGEGGVWINTHMNCALGVAGQPCEYDRTTRTAACPVFTSGGQHLACIGGVWTLQEGTCTDTQCGGDTIGSTREASCPSGFSGKVTQTCTAAQSWHTTVIDCHPTSGQSCPTVGDSRSLECPFGVAGEIIQSCLSMGGGGEWVMTHNSCDSTRCGDQPIGAVRPTSTPCPTGKTGSLIEVCAEDGKWHESDSECTPLKCLPQAGYGDGNATWPSSLANDAVLVTGTCISGTGSPRRTCRADGSWGTVDTGTQCGSNCLLMHVPGFDAARVTPDAGGTVYPNNSTVNFSCKLNYTGPATHLTCRDGSWEGNGPLCRQSCSPTEPHNSTRCHLTTPERCIEGSWKPCFGSGCPSC